MEEKRWESCNAEALLDEFFSQDNLRQLALSTGELLGCPLLVLDDTFHGTAHHLPLGFSDALFETAVRCGEITYEAGAIISKNAMLTAGWADYVQLADSPYRRRFAPLISAGVRLGCLICVDTDGHLEKIPPQTWELVEHILAKQLFMEVSRQDKPSETAEDILMHLLDGGFSSAAHFQLQASGTYLADFHPLTFALIDLETYHNAYMGKRHLKEELEAQIAGLKGELETAQSKLGQLKADPGSLPEVTLPIDDALFASCKEILAKYDPHYDPGTLPANLEESKSDLTKMTAMQASIEIGRARVGKECRSRWSPYH